MRSLALALATVAALTFSPARADDTVEAVNMSIRVTQMMQLLDSNLAMRKMDAPAKKRIMDMRARAIDLYRDGKMQEALDLFARMLSDMSVRGGG